MPLVITDRQATRGARAPWWYAPVNYPPNLHFMASVYYPLPIAWFIRVRDALFVHTVVAVASWLYELAIIDALETREIQHWWSVFDNFTLRGSIIYERQKARHHLDLIQERGYKAGYEAGHEAAFQQLDDAIAHRDQNKQEG